MEISKSWRNPRFYDIKVYRLKRKYRQFYKILVTGCTEDWQLQLQPVTKKIGQNDILSQSKLQITLKLGGFPMELLQRCIQVSERDKNFNIQYGILMISRHPTIRTLRVSQTGICWRMFFLTAVVFRKRNRWCLGQSRSTNSALVALDDADQRLF